MDNMWNLPNEDTYLHGENLCQQMNEEVLHIAVTAAGHCIAPNLLYLIAKGEVFGETQPIVLHLVDAPNCMNTVRGFSMEFLDSGFPLLKDCIATDKLPEAFKDIDVAFLLPYPNLTPQNNRKDKLGERLSLAKLHGEALNVYAKKTVKVVVVGHFANLWVLFCSRFAPTIPLENFTGVSRFVQNFATSLLSLRLRVRVEDIKDLIVWGNYSEKMYTDLRHATVKLPLMDREIGAYAAVKNDYWVKGHYNAVIQQSAIDVSDSKRCIAMAVGAAEHMRDWWQGTKPDHLTSMIVVSNGAYNVPKGLFFSFPVVIKDKKWKILEGLHIDVFTQIKIDENIEEHKEQYKEATHFCDGFWQIPRAVPVD